MADTQETSQATLTPGEIISLMDLVHMWTEIQCAEDSRTSLVRGFNGIVSHPIKGNCIRVEVAKTENDFSYKDPTQAGEMYGVTVFGDYDRPGKTERVLGQMQGRKRSQAYHFYNNIKIAQDKRQEDHDLKYGSERRLEELLAEAREIFRSTRRC